MSNTVTSLPHRFGSSELGATRIVALGLVIMLLVALVPSSAAIAQAATVSGVIYEDRNDNGTRDGGEPGIAGITAVLYTSTNASAGLATSLANGSYSITPTAAGPYRLEFSSIPVGMQPSATGTNNGSSILFLNAAGTADFGVTRPLIFCQANPDLATTCHTPGDQAAINDTVLYTMPYNSVGFVTPPTAKAFSQQIGTTWGLAYQPATDSLFSSAFMKRHAAFGPSGTGAIYRTTQARGAGSTTALFLDLNALLGAGTTGVDGRVPAVDYHTDATAFDQVGKIALGDVDLGTDGQSLWTINLNTRQLYNIPIGLTPTAPTLASQILQYNIPLPTGVGICPSANDIRPFGIDVHDGLVYVGMVCTAQSSQLAADLRALVYAFDPVTTTFTQVLNFPLNYPRRCIDKLPAAVVCSTPDLVAPWRPWPNTPFSLAAIDVPVADGFVGYPQPWLTDIVFDDGDIIMAFRDRFGDQTGYQERDLNGTGAFSGIASGDILRACANGIGGWTLENNGTCGAITTAGAGDTQGPGGGEYFFGDKHPNHDGISVGGLAQVPGMDDVVVTAFDPIPTRTFEGGLIWLNNTTGAKTRGYRVYGDNQTTVAGSRFAKSNGMGDLLALCDAAPVEIGNRVWFDVNANGVQDPNETPVNGVTVELVNAGGTVIGTAITDSEGRYIFSNDPNRTSAVTSVVYDPAMLRFGQQYSVRIPLNQARLNTWFVTKQDNDTSTGGNTRDSDGDNSFAPAGAGMPGFTTMTFVVGGPGQNNHTYDFGFTISPASVVLTQLSATLVGKAIVVDWTTAAEVDTFGYRIYRSDDGIWANAQLMTQQLIPALGRGNAHQYSWYDRSHPIAAKTRYWLVEVETNGTTQRYGPIRPVPRVADLPYSLFIPGIQR